MRAKRGKERKGEERREVRNLPSTILLS